MSTHARLAYYNDNEPFVCAWLRELIAADLIAPGEVDNRDVWDIRPDDLRGFAQVHLFAGIGGWSRALRLAGWPDERPVFTASCPCQPFSAAGKRGGTADERHLWPAAFHLIDSCRPDVVFGEQVASRDGLAWLDLVLSDLEGAGYTAGAVDLCAAGVGAPHIRQRLFFVAESRIVAYDTGDGLERSRSEDCRGSATRIRQRGHGPWGCSTSRLLADTEQPERRAEQQAGGAGSRGCGLGGGGELGDAGEPGLEGHIKRRDGTGERATRETGVGSGMGDTEGERRQVRTPEGTGAGRLAGRSFWSDCEWLPCRDGKARPTQPGLLPLAHGVPNRVGTLRGAGNAIVPQVGAEVVKAYMGRQV